MVLYALDKGVVDAVIVSGMNAERPWRVEPKVVRTGEEVLAIATSKYTISPNNVLLDEVERLGIERLGIFGLPCHIEGIRKMHMYGRPKKLLK